ncbi:glycosyltransferase family 39 protein [Williamwhitmania taraxaci]|uniref:Alg9-like mannosyltransferase family protein n=1 Tax=Williamwhitmania taraxaci TaxID=1640674 RepID=A0A1G6RLF1_9BACT|nr:glycosyltransferase family 39 protein [Williamwhitmania taraxaci]SDD05500.1 Alg9-like mannosyltransferase family protein [Williamwhitmania taraxaci]
MDYLKRTWATQPLRLILIGALCVRILAAIFSQGYGMHDDHFLVLEASQSWVDGTDYNDWLPKSQVDPIPAGHSFFYVGAHYIVLSLFKAIGIDDPKIKVFLIRLLHALLSLVVVAFGYKLAERFGGRKAAIQVGIALSFLWFMPMLSIRNFVEVACIPFLIMGVWYAYTAMEDNRSWSRYLLAGLMIGLAFSIRFQTVIFIGGVGLAILLRKKFWESIIFGLGVLISIFLIQGIVDLFIWGRPFAELGEYVRYNIEHKYDYGNNNPIMYISIIVGVMLPPLGWLWLAGFFRSWKKTLIIALPSLLFLIFHTYFPNKQERFIFPVLPFFVIAGVTGWVKMTESKFWQNRPRLIMWFTVIFWVFNGLLFLPTTLSSSKLSRIDSMYFLYGKQVKNGILVEDRFHENVNLLPNFYAGNWFIQYELPKVDSSKMCDALIHKQAIGSSRYRAIINTINYFDSVSIDKLPEYVFICEDKDLEARKAAIERVFPPLTLEAVILPSRLDVLMYKQSRSNRNQTIFIYKVGSKR